jgi:4-hydroxybenzoate polyprenyltransferase
MFRASKGATTTMRDWLLVLRLHIVMIAVMGTLVFGWLLTDRYAWAVALVVGLDWLLVNLLNRASDVPEDLVNGIPATERIAARRWLVFVTFGVVFGGSLAVTHLWQPALTGWRVFMQATGLIYSFRLIPTPRGRVRLKDVYFLKNFMSALGFITTCFFYPLATNGYLPVIGWPAALALMLYFVPFELSYEILYDLRDVEGDRAQAVPTYPVRHGVATTHRIIRGLLLGSIALCVTMFLAGVLGVRELLMAFGPAIQFFALQPILRRGPDTRDCVRITNLGWGLLGLYLLCTAWWIHAGLPENLFLWKLVTSA